MSEMIRFAPVKGFAARMALAGALFVMAACSGSDSIDPLARGASLDHKPGHGSPLPPSQPTSPSQATSLATPVPSVNVSGSTVTISWPAVPNAIEYMVVSSAGTTPKTTAISVVHRNVPNGSHTAKVRALTTASNNESGFSTDVVFTVDVPAATPPVNTPPVNTPPAGDGTPPVIAAPSITGTLGSSGWYTSDVTVEWTATDAESLVTLSGCSVSVTSDTPGNTFTCTATSAGGSSTASITIKRDASAPTVTANLSGTAGNNGWFVSNVGVSFTVTANGPSLLGPSTGCSSSTVTADGQFSYTCSAESGAGLSSSATAAVKRDASTPTVTANLSGTAGNNGWFVSNVDVSFTVTANGPSLLGPSTGCSSSTVTTDGPFTFTCSAESGAGLSSSATAAGKKDATLPVIAFSGNAGAYTVDQTVSITCSASDVTSGIATSSCPGVSSGAAYTFIIGSNVGSATASDKAGNTENATTIFTVSVTYASLCNLTKRFVSHTGIANSLCVKLNAAEAAALRGNLAAKAGPLNAYVKEVQAQTGKSITAANAAILIRLVAFL